MLPRLASGALPRLRAAEGDPPGVARVALFDARGRRGPVGADLAARARGVGRGGRVGEGSRLLAHRALQMLEPEAAAKAKAARPPVKE